MRDDRYRGTSLSGPVRKLCRMAERDADRARPDLLRKQALAALVSHASEEISPDFRRQLRERDARPSLFATSELATAARTSLEAEIAQNIEGSRGVPSRDAICDALRRRGEGYAREQRCQLIADRHPHATVASESVKKACSEVASAAAELILAGRPAPRTSGRIGLAENLLAQSSKGGGL